MEELLKQFWPSVVAMATGGGVFSYVLAQQRRRDNNDRTLLHQARMYEIAYRRCDGYCRQMATLVGPAAEAAMLGNTELALTYLRLVYSHMSEDAGSGGRRLAPHPDFLEQARHELDQFHIEQDGE